MILLVTSPFLIVPREELQNCPPCKKCPSYNSSGYKSPVRLVGGTCHEAGEAGEGVVYDEHSSSMEITTHLDHIDHCKTASGANWSNRWTYRVLVTNTCDEAGEAEEGVVPHLQAAQPAHLSSECDNQYDSHSHIEDSRSHRLSVKRSAYLSSECGTSMTVDKSHKTVTVTYKTVTVTDYLSVASAGCPARPSVEHIRQSIGQSQSYIRQPQSYIRQSQASAGWPVRASVERIWNILDSQ